MSAFSASSTTYSSSSYGGVQVKSISLAANLAPNLFFFDMMC